MTKAASTPICAIVLLTATMVFAQETAPTAPPPAPPPAVVQPATPPPAVAPAAPAASPISTAVNEAVRRQAATVMLREKLAEARAAELRNDLPTAAKLYDDAWTLVESIGPGVEREAQQTVAGLANVRLALAQQAQKRQDYLDADTQIKDVLRVDPRNAVALEFRRANNRLLEAQRGTRPSAAAQEQVPIVREERITSATLVQDGKLFYEMGKLDEAAQKLDQALALDPNNAAAIYYAGLVNQAKQHRVSNRRNIFSGRQIVEIGEAWEDPVRRDLLPVPNPMARTNLVYTGKGRQAIMSKLERINLDQVVYPGVPLPEVIRNLSEEARKRDPERTGVNFMISPETVTALPTPPPGGVQQPIFDPVTGAQIQAPVTQVEPPDINAVNIRIDPPLMNIRMADALDAIVRVADQPIKYSIEDYAIVFSFRGAETPRLEIRTFKVDPNTFYGGLESVGSLDFSQLLQSISQGGGGGGGGGGAGQAGMIVPRVNVAGGATGGGGGGGGGQSGEGLPFVTRTNSMLAVQQAVIGFFQAVGVNLDPQNPANAGKTVFFNDREGTLMVRATSQELDVIEAAIQTLNIAPPQVNIKAKFVEVTQLDSRALGFDWYLGNFLMANQSVVGSAGTQPSFTGQPSPANPEGTFPGSTVFGTVIPPSTTDGLLTPQTAMSPVGAPLATFTGILTDPQFRVVIRALQNRSGADVLTEGQVTTLSGRQAQFQVVNLETIFVANSAQQSTAAGAAVTGGTTPIQGVGFNTIVPVASVFPLGPTLDVIPYVSADGYTIQMTLLPSILEFLGYDEAAFQTFAQAAGGSGASAPLAVPTPAPKFRLRQVTTSAIVWDGQTIVLGGLISDKVTKIKDQIPVLGDLPFIGRLFRNEANQSEKGNLLVFVTPTIVDPAGNRVHLPDELPFAQSTVPAQKPVVVNP